MSPQAQAVLGRLESTWARWWTYSLWTGLVLVVALSLGSLATFVFLDALFRLGQGAIGVLFTAWVLLSAVLLGFMMVRLVRYRRSAEALARRVELDHPELGSHLINLVQLSQADGDGNPAGGEVTEESNLEKRFRLAAANQAAEAVGDFRFESAATKQSRWRRFLLCMQTPRDLAEALLALLAVLSLLLLAQMLLPSWATSTRRLLHPWVFVPSAGAVRILEVTPGNTEVLIGSGLNIAATIDNPRKSAYPAKLFIKTRGKPESAAAMMPQAGNSQYVAALPQVAEPLWYRVEIGDSQSPQYKVAVYEKPAVAEMEVTYEYAPYLSRDSETVKQKHADLEAPQLTRALLKIKPTVPVRAGYLSIDERKVYGEVGRDGTLAAELWLLDNTVYTINLTTTGGHEDPSPRVNKVRVVPDEPPTAQIAEPAKQSSTALGETANIVIRAADDYGLGQVRLEVRVGDDPNQTATPAVLASWDRFAEGKAAVLKHPFLLEPGKYQAGQSVHVRAVARDCRSLSLPDRVLKPQETASPWHQISVLDPDAKVAAELDQNDKTRASLYAILQQQIRARVALAELTRIAGIEEAKSKAGQSRDQQVAIQQATVQVVQDIGETQDEEQLVIKRVVNKLAFDDMLQAVQQAEVLAKAPDAAALKQGADTLGATQDKIIDVLRRLLSELRKDSTELLSEMKKRPDSQIPPDVQDKLRDLKKELEEFLKQQKKVIEASENLAKKPVEDFSEEELKELKDLAAVEDDWSKFMADTQSDLSKLPEQDFSNPSALQELVDIATELKMAEGALTKKTADIAVPLEQLGAEMAEEMTTNIEKWLPDTPDRERWSQEEPLSDEMKEAPMAELPQELEDIVGELMEEEEDLFDEMEDISSSWADSLDKGAGWDALDGPISNMSARGVTGNRLPNTSEIGGRSGEGRSGKSSGEFVGDTAVGKGGRKTPTRLTPDAFVKGEIKDTSKDPVGGATGGGKTSGVGGEGLQGPVPDRPQETLARLASKQASLRNKAEGVDLKFQVMKYHHTDLKNLISQMQAVEQDLRAGRFSHALRRRDVLLDGLGQVRMFLSGEFEVRQDQTANLPTDIQKEILGSMSELSPEGWDELNRQYFERLK